MISMSEAGRILESTLADYSRQRPARADIRGPRIAWQTASRVSGL